MLLRNARLDDASDPVDLAISGDRVVGVCDGPVMDLGGRLVLPGFWDAHVHFDQWALSQAAIDLSAAESAVSVARILASAAGDDLVVAHGFRDGMWPDVPTVALLDAHTGARPVVAISADLHCAWFNTAALQRFSIGPYHGLVRERDFMPRMNEIQSIDHSRLDRLVADAARAAAARGVVGVVDFEIADNVASWARRVGGGLDILRVRCGIWPEWLDSAVVAGLRTGDAIPGTGGLVTVGPLKVIVDGSLGTRTAYCHDRYPGGDHGVLNMSPNRLQQIMSRAHSNGLECAIHAIGDAACAVVVDAFAATGARGSIEHAQLVADADLTVFAELGVTASVQPAHVYDDAPLADRYWCGRTTRAFPYGSLHRAGVRITLGSDAPVAPLDPWRTLRAAVDRTQPDGRRWHPEHELPWDVALAASTGGRTRLTAGDVADLVVLDTDTLPRRGPGLADVPVAATMVGGRWVFAAGAICEEVSDANNR